MPEGPSVKKFYTLASPFVGQLVIKVGGSTKQIKLNDLKDLWLQDCQVHGKNLYLAFGSDLGTPVGDNLTHEDMEPGPSSQNTMHLQGSGQSLQDEQEQQMPDCQKGFEINELHREKEKACDGRATVKDPWKWLHFHFGLFGSIRANEFSRTTQANKRGDWRDPKPRLVLDFDDGGFLAFYNCRMLWCSHPFKKPSCDILSTKFNRGQALTALRQQRSVCYTLMDQRYFSGLGNIIKNEILFLSGIHPLTPGSLLDHKSLEALLDHALHFTSGWLQSKLQGKGLHYHIYLKETCPLGHPVTKDKLGPPGGFKRLTWWCPECQPQVFPKQDQKP